MRSHYIGQSLVCGRQSPVVVHSDGYLLLGHECVQSDTNVMSVSPWVTQWSSSHWGGDMLTPDPLGKVSVFVLGFIHSSSWSICPDIAEVNGGFYLVCPSMCFALQLWQSGRRILTVIWPFRFMGNCWHSSFFFFFFTLACLYILIYIDISHFFITLH